MNAIDFQDREAEMMADEIFLTQSDPMKVLPPKDNEIIRNDYGAAIMNEKTANKLLEKAVLYRHVEDNVRTNTINEVLEIIDSEEEAVADGEYGSVICGLERVRTAVKALGEEQG